MRKHLVVRVLVKEHREHMLQLDGLDGLRNLWVVLLGGDQDGVAGLTCGTGCVIVKRSSPR